MANAERGEFTLTIEGKPIRLTLRLTTNAAVELEELSGGLTFEQVQAGVQRGSLKHIRFLFWAALRSYHKDIATTDGKGLEHVGNFIDKLGTVEDLLPRLREFLALNVEPVEEQQETAKGRGRTSRPRKAQARAGATSTSTRSKSA